VAKQERYTLLPGVETLFFHGCHANGIYLVVCSIRWDVSGGAALIIGDRWRMRSASCDWRREMNMGIGSGYWLSNVFSASNPSQCRTQVPYMQRRGL